MEEKPLSSKGLKISQSSIMFGSVGRTSDELTFGVQGTLY